MARERTHTYAVMDVERQQSRYEEGGNARNRSAGLGRGGLRRRRDHEYSIFSKVSSAPHHGEECITGSRQWRSPAWGKPESLSAPAPRRRRRPAAIFFVQALLSFVGVFVIPTRLAYEVLVQPGFAETSASRGSDESLFQLSGRGAVAVTSAASGEIAPRPKSDNDFIRQEEEKEGRSWSASFGGQHRVVKTERGLAVTSAARAGGRLLMQAEDEGDSFTYGARTQFHLCVATGVQLEEEILKASIVEVFDVDESQVRIAQSRRV